MSKFFRPGKPGSNRDNDKRGDGKPFRKKPFGRGSDKPARFKSSDDKPVSSRKEFDAWKSRSGSDKPAGDKPFKKSFDKYPGKKPFKRDDDFAGEDKPRSSSYSRPYDAKKKFAKPYGKKKFTKGTFGQQAEKAPSDLIRLNKYLSNAGVSSRREADRLIESGVVTVNGNVVTELGYKISPGDEVKFGGAILRKEKPVYILLNKPKDYITTSKDPQERRTVMQLIEGACKERVYPVGRLDRMTTGLLLFTNDGEVAKRLTHPSHGAKKMYHVTLDQNLSLADMKNIQEGVELEDGRAEVDAIEFVEGAGRKEIGIELHSGRNRVVRRIFESLGYNVVKLDRVMFAGLTKKDLQRGHWRKLSEKEVGMLMMRK